MVASNSHWGHAKQNIVSIPVIEDNREKNSPGDGVIKLEWHDPEGPF